MIPAEVCAYNAGIEAAAWEMDRRAFRVSAGLIRALKKPVPVQAPVYTKAVCRGSYALGTACGRCERCQHERPSK